MSAPIIITVPNNYLTVDKESKVILDSNTTTPSRKRRLDHLTWEEKMQRKKLKNRVAAQTSRDRKKAKMDEMEKRIQDISDMNEKLLNEVASLKALNERLLSENAALRSEAAARTVAGAQGPAEGGAPGGDPRGAPVAGDVSPLADLLAHLDSPEYLDTLHQLADSLLQEIDAGSTGTAKDVTDRGTGECTKGTQVVGTSPEHVEPSEGAVVNLKHDIDRILSQHSYAHPYKPDPVVDLTDTVEVKEENNDKGDMFFASYDDANDCITIEVPCEEQTIDTMGDKSDKMDTELSVLTDCPGIGLECELKLLSPMTLSPNSMDENLLGVSPAHTSLSSDLGYESLASPLSEPDSIDLSDFWCESFSELFPGLA